MYLSIDDKTIEQSVQLNSFVDVLENRALQDGDKMAFTYLIDGEIEGPSLTYRELVERARALAGRLQSSTKPGDRALLLYTPGLEYIVAFLGCLFAGVVPVPAYPPDPTRLKRMLPRLTGIVKDCQAKLILTSADILWKIRVLTLRSPSLLVKTWIATDKTPLHLASHYRPIDLKRDQLAFLQYTSGSTGQPKGVMVTHGNLIHNCQTIRTGASYRNDDRVVTWLPLYHDMGLIGQVLQPIYSGLSVWVMSPIDFLKNPYRWLSALTRFKGTATGGPNFAYELCVAKITEDQKKSIDLSHWTLAFCGAEPVRSETLEKFALAFRACGFDRRAFYPCFGLAEATLMVSGMDRGKGARIVTFDAEQMKAGKAQPSLGGTQSLVSCGAASLPDCKVLIVNPQTRMECKTNEIGEIWTKSGSNAAGYWNKPELTSEIFGARLNGTEEGPFLKTGDLGFNDGKEIFVTGRLKDLIIINGQNHFPSDIESTVYSAHASIRPGCCVAFSEERNQKEGLIVVAEIKTLGKVDQEEIKRAIKKSIFEKHDLNPADVVLIKAGTIPKTTSGKLQRSDCKSLFRDGKLAVAAQKKVHTVGSPGGTLEGRLASILARELGIEATTIDSTAHFGAIGMSSIQAVSFAKSICDELQVNFSPASLWQYTNLKALSAYLAKQGRFEPKSKPSKVVEPEVESSEDVAIVGMACRFPGCDGIEEFWEGLLKEKSFISDPPEDRWGSSVYSPVVEELRKTGHLEAGYLRDIDRFDPLFFGISPREARMIDPQQRIFLQAVWHALEDAGVKPSTLGGEEVGIYVGCSSSDYIEAVQAHGSSVDLQFVTGNAHSILANRISFFLNLRGPSKTIDTACSSSLVAVHDAIRSLVQGECKIAIAGGVNAILTPTITQVFARAGMLSKNGKCKTFDNQADGYVRGEGVGAVVLKKLSDAIRDGDQVHAVIKGSAINHSGHTHSLTAPNPSAQADLLRLAWRRARTAPETIQYIEAHGTATPLGDPIEVAAIQSAFGGVTGTQNAECILGSVKTNLGHLEAAAGIAGLIKLALSLKHRTIPRSLHFSELNSHIDLKEGSLRIANTTIGWPSNPLERRAQKRRGGVSSFGFGGTNCHIVLEEASDSKPQAGSQANSQPEGQLRPEVVFISAKTEESLQSYLKKFERFIGGRNSPSLEEIAWMTQHGRDEFEWRASLVSHSIEQLKKQLQIAQETGASPDQGVFLGKAPPRAGVLSISPSHFSGLERFASSWVQGAVVERPISGFPTKPRKRSLPGYPFSKQRFWFEENVIHPLIDSFTAQGNEFRFKKVFRNDFYVRDHVVRDHCIVPAVVYLEMVRKAGELAFPNSRVERISNVVWIKPIEVLETREVLLVVQKRQSGLSFKIFSEVENVKILHCEGEVSLQEKSLNRPPKYEFRSDLLSFDRTLNHSEIYSKFNELGLHYGDTFQCMRKLESAQKHALSELEIYLPTQNDAEFSLHPSLLDAALGTCTGIELLTAGDEGKVFVPFSLQDMTILGPVSGPCRAIAELDGDYSEKDPIKKFNVTVINPDSEVLVIFRGVGVKAIPLSLAPSKNSLLFYAPEWVAESYPALKRDHAVPLILIGSPGIKSELEKVSCPIGLFTESTEGLKKFLPTLDTAQGLQVIVSVDSPDVAFHLGIHREIFDSLVGVVSSASIRVIVLLPLNESGTLIAGALAGFARSLLGISHRYQTLLVQADGESPVRMAQAAIDEMGQSTQASGARIQYRPQGRLVQRWQELKKMNSLSSPRLGILPRFGARYLITGGMGGLGRILAETLVEKHGAEVILLGRSSLSSVTGTTGEARKKLKPGMTYVQGDVTSIDQMQKAMEEIGSIDGVIHCAGVAPEQSCGTVEELSQVLGPKTLGTLNLYRLLKDKKLDFFLLFSSTSAILGDFSEGIYAAANGFLDAFAEVTSSSDPRVISINWPLWENGGMRLPENEAEIYSKHLGMTPLPSDSALQAFGEVLKQDVPQIAVFYGNEKKILGRMEASFRPKLESSLAEAPEAIINTIPSPLSSKEGVQEALTAILSKILRIPEAQLDPERELAEYGADSITMMEFLEKVRARFGDVLTTQELFQNRRLKELATIVSKKTQSVAAGPCQAPEVLNSLQPNEVSPFFPLSHAQKALWFIHELSPDNYAYNIPIGLIFKEQLDKTALLWAIQKVAHLQPSLRTSFVVRNDIPQQIVNENTGVAFQEVTVKDGGQDELKSLIAADARRAFDLSGAPPFRVTLYRVPNGENVLVICAHHIIFDGLSVLLLIEQLKHHYRKIKSGDFSMGTPPQLTVRDRVAFEERRLNGPEGKIDFEFWKAKFAKGLPTLELPTDRPRPLTKTYNGATYRFEVETESYLKLKKFAKEEKVTPFSVLFSAFLVFLHQQSRQEELVVGTPLLGRTDAGFEQVLGYFTNIVVLLQKVRGEMKFRNLVHAVQSDLREVLAHQNYPFPLLVEKLKLKRNPSRSPGFDVCFVFQNMLKGDTFAQHRSGLSGLSGPSVKDEIDYFHINQQEGQFDLELELVELDDKLTGNFKYNTDIYLAPTIERFTRSLQTLFAWIGKVNPNSFEGSINLNQDLIENMPNQHPNDLAQALSEWNSTDRDFGIDMPLHAVFEAQAKRTPENLAVFFQGASLTYRTLNDRANQLAHFLRAQGVGENQLVALVMERSIEMVVAIYGILKAGGAYVPMDPTYPDKRVRSMLENSKPILVLTQSRFEMQIAQFNVKHFSLDQDWKQVESYPCSSLPWSADLTLPAYVIYTSGSTGEPKGVVISHAGVCNRIFWMQDYFQLRENDRILQKTPYCFDVSVWEFFWPLLYGAVLDVLPPEKHKDPTYLSSYIVQQGVTILHFVPSMLSAFLEEPAARGCETLKKVICSGEALPIEAQREFFRVFSDAELYNLYGPTEASVDVSYWKCDKTSFADVVPIGRPISNIQLYIVDSKMNPVPVGVSGELCISGIGLALEYLRKPEQTREKFVRNPFSSTLGSRLYKTGDLARYLSDGNIEYMGRIDSQVKIRGFRIELGDVERAILRHASIKTAAVITRDSTLGQKELVAYFVPTKDRVFSSSELRNHLASELPEYMIPAYFVRLDEIPLSSNGKLDRNSLPNLSSPAEGHVEGSKTGGTVREIVLPRNSIEEKLLSCWKSLLKLEQIGVTEDFFALGGNSLLSIQLTREMNRVLEARETRGNLISVRDFYLKPTVEAVAERLVNGRSQSLLSLVDEVHLDPRIRFDSPTAIDRTGESSPYYSVLLTGATGFLGAYLLRDLLEESKVRVYCLVRSSSEPEAFDRVRSNMEKYKLWKEEYSSRLNAVPGDVSRKNLGLSDELYRYLSGKVVAVYHNAARVNFLEPYHRLKTDNVVATQEMIAFACERTRKTLHYVSTVSVFSSRQYQSQDVVTEEAHGISELLPNGYSQSKWVAEQLVLKAGQNGLPIRIYRLGTISGDSTTGQFNHDDLVNRLFLGCLQLKAVPSFERRMELLPADFVSKAVVRISLLANIEQPIFHLAHPRPPSQREVFEKMKALGHDLHEVSYTDWVTRLTVTSGNCLETLLPLFIDQVGDTQLSQAELAQNLPQVVCPKTEAILKELNLTFPEINSALLCLYAKTLLS